MCSGAPTFDRNTQGLFVMPYLRRGKGKGKGKGSSSCTMRKPVQEDEPDMEEVPSDNTPPDTPEIEEDHDDASGHEDDDEDDCRPLGRRKKGSNERYHLFTMDEEDSIVEWWREREWLYNAAHPWHLDKGRKERAYARKAKELKCEGMYIYLKKIYTYKKNSAINC